MKKLITFVFGVMMVVGCKNKGDKTKDEATNDSVAEVKLEAQEPEEWITLFDGTSMDAWQAFKGGEVPEYWSIEEGNMVFNPPAPEKRKNADGKGYNSFNIVTKKEFTNFVLSLEWKISEGGNSGIFWGVSEDEKYSEPYQTGLEVQVLDNTKHPDAKNGTTHQAGALYDLVEPSEDVTKPAGEWNTCVITINHKTNKGSSVLNGVEIATFPVGGEELATMLKDSKFNGWDGFAAFKTGKIGLQDHGDIVSYRNIKIKEL